MDGRGFVGLSGVCAMSLSGMTMDLLEGAKGRVSALGSDLAQAPDELHGVVATVSSALMSGSGVRAVTYLLILMLVGCGAEWLYWSYAWAPLRAIESMPVASPRQALRLGARRFGLLGSGLLIFTLAIIATSAAFAWPPGIQQLVVAVTLLVLVLRLAWIAASVVLAPGRARLRLVPVAQRRMGWLVATVLATAGLAAIASLAPVALEQVAKAPHAAGMIRFVCVALTAVLLVVAAFAFVRDPASPAAVGRRLRLPKFPRSIVVALMVVAVFLLWLLASTTAAVIAAIASVVIVVQMGLREVVFFFWREEIQAAASDAAIAQAADNELSDPALMPSIVLSAARFVVVLLGLGACAIALHAPMGELAASQNFAVRFGFQLLGVAALALFANVVWILVRTTIDHRLKRIGPHDAHAAASNPNARLLTLLPLLRTTAAVLLGVLLVLSSLWALGIEITPLLAGAGVIGLAVGFGAQALVRDVIAGIFFLAEDVFRVGEYVESGTTTKGTVERITLRTVALRHHNGPLHFVPYGSLGTVRNNSRDWVIEKFNLPLPIDVDSEKIRKLIKKIGQEMMKDPEIGPMLREPLKSKLARIDPGVKVFRCKFQTAPGNQFDVRAQAFKRIEAGLRTMGIGFADGTQTIILERSSGVVPTASGATP
jgi:small-conductance mechanosensitive channel